MNFKKYILSVLLVALWVTWCTKVYSQSKDEKNMKELLVHKIHHEGQTGISDVKKLLESNAPLNAINVINWEKFDYTPEVQFRIGHVENEIWIVFYVREKHILAKRTATNSSTHKDSCVEFFIDPKKDGQYYNFEFNAIGTTHLAHGPVVQKRSFIDPAMIDSLIRTHSSLGTQPIDLQNGVHSWDLTVVIPAEILIHENTKTISGLIANANFYKCGDETIEPHYLSWNPVPVERPSFHQPQYFGRLVFE